MEPWVNSDVEIVPICPEENKKYCYIAWANIGHIFASKTISPMRRHEIITVFTKLDQLFGKHQPFHSVMFTLYGKYNHQPDVLFHNNTKILATENILGMHPYGSMPLNFERAILNDTAICQISDFSPNAACKMASTFFILIATLIVYIMNS